MSTPEVNTVGPVGGSALSKDPLSVCKVCFNLDPELIPPDVGISRDLESENRRAVKLISRTGDEMRASAARGCISCSVLLEGVSIHCSVLCNDVNWNPRERLKEVKLLFNLKFTLILQPIFTSTTLDKLGAPRERDNLECALEFYTKNGDVQLFPAFGISRDMPTNLNLDSCLEVVKPWLEECSKNHPACKPPLPSESEMPIRILDIESFESGFIRLVESSRIQCKDYITLSHCWGEVQPITTMKSNLKYHYSGIPIHQLPATFYEAVLITSALKIQYLWIDSLCIVQDDPYDWEAEAAKMATVYRSSYLTLAALHSPNSHGGCFSSRYKKETPDWMNPNCILRAATESKSLQHRGVNNVIHTTMTRLLPRNAHSLFMGSEPNDTPLGSRAWALQERLMASRTLYFHYEELVWECHACLACECQALQRYKDILQYLDIMKSPVVFCTKSNVHLERNSSRETILREWLRLVTVYSTLKLSKRSDVLPALSGLARHFSDLTPLGVYAAGIWSCDLARSLVWEKTLQTYDDRDAYSHTSTPYDEGMPSWSWTSIISGFLEEKFQVSYEAVLNRGFIQDDHFDVTPEGSWESSIQDSSANAFNLSSGKRIRVSGLVIAANYSGLWGDRPGPSFYTQAPGLFQKSVKFSPDADLSLPGPYQTLEGELLSCIFVGKTGPRSYDGDYVRLVLVLKSSKEQGVFRRIGYNEVGRLDPSFENANVDTLVIM